MSADAPKRVRETKAVLATRLERMERELKSVKRWNAEQVQQAVAEATAQIRAEVIEIEQAAGYRICILKLLNLELLLPELTEMIQQARKGGDIGLGWQVVAWNGVSVWPPGAALSHSEAGDE